MVFKSIDGSLLIKFWKLVVSPQGYGTPICFGTPIRGGLSFFFEHWKRNNAVVKAHDIAIP